MTEFPKTIKLGLALVIFGSSGLAIHNPTIILSNTLHLAILLVESCLG